MIDVFIEPHERHEALEAYRQWLTSAQEAEIKDAPETAIIRLRRVKPGGTIVTVIEEG
jgi:hypothetical protein